MEVRVIKIEDTKDVSGVLNQIFREIEGMESNDKNNTGNVVKYTNAQAEQFAKVQIIKGIVKMVTDLPDTNGEPIANVDSEVASQYLEVSERIDYIFMGLFNDMLINMLDAYRNKSEDDSDESEDEGTPTHDDHDHECGDEELNEIIAQNVEDFNSLMDILKPIFTAMDCDQDMSNPVLITMDPDTL